MNVRLKIGLQLSGGVLVVLALSQAVQLVQVRRSNARLAGSSEMLLNQRELQNVRNIHAALDFGLADSLARGDMEIFGKLSSLQHDLPGFTQFSLYDQNGAVALSSQKGIKGQPINPQLKGQLYSKPDRLVLATNGLIEVYKPELATAKCVECHETFKAGTICGVSYFSFTNNAKAAVAAQFDTITASANRQ